MASPTQKANALLKLIQMLEGNRSALKPVPNRADTGVGAGPGPNAFDGHTPESAIGMAEEVPIEEVLDIGPTLLTRQKRELKSKIEPEPRKGDQLNLFRGKAGEEKTVINQLDDRAAFT